jgi:hypothetical protein
LSLSFSHDSRYLISGARDKKIALFILESGEKVAE